MTNELLKDKELDAVSGGSGIETIALMARLQSAGIATFSTQLVIGNEKAAADELKAYLLSLKDSSGRNRFGNPLIFSDDRENQYFNGMMVATAMPYTTQTELAFMYIKNDNVFAQLQTH